VKLTLHARYLAPALVPLLGDKRYAAAAARFWESLGLLGSCDGLVCVWFNADTMTCDGWQQEISWGASADSAYE
jgi:hypothetical protein